MILEMISRAWAKGELIALTSYPELNRTSVLFLEIWTLYWMHNTHYNAFWLAITNREIVETATIFCLWTVSDIVSFLVTALAGNMADVFFSWRLVLSLVIETLFAAIVFLPQYFFFSVWVFLTTSSGYTVIVAVNLIFSVCLPDSLKISWREHLLQERAWFRSLKLWIRALNLALLAALTNSSQVNHSQPTLSIFNFIEDFHPS